jgi:diaminohydroxyphosphoribosylaminopyrimidine deaminase/5-amino-6-(5-phosphoribosylamino)uracil reductase
MTDTPYWPVNADARHALKTALDLAASAIGLSEPNPRVGCVITSADGQQCLGQGHTQAAGQAHAEVMALRQAAACGHALRGATAYVSLEPCSHHGRTPPCCDALIAAGLGRVVVAVEDPNPQVSGAGIARLRAAGIRVDLGPADLAQSARELNIGFFSRMERGRPWVRLKMAASLDGRTALDNGLSQWITGAAARTDGHAWRKRSGAILSARGTVQADNPRLDVRLVDSVLQPLRAIVDSQLQVDTSAQLFERPSGLVFYAARPLPDRITALQDAGAEVVCLPTANGAQVDLHAVLADLAARQVNELHVEAGAGLSTALLQAGLVDECLLYLAPTLIGPGRGLVEWPALTDLTQALRLEFLDATPVGGDLRIRLRRPVDRPV